MESCVRNICAKNYQNLIIGFQVTVENVGDVFWDTVYYVDVASYVQYFTVILFSDSAIFFVALMTHTWSLKKYFQQ